MKILKYILLSGLKGLGLLSILDILVASYCMLMMSTIIVICNFILIISIINCFEKGNESNFSFLRIVQIIPQQAQSTQQQILEGLSTNPEPLWGQFRLHGHRLDANS